MTSTKLHPILHAKAQTLITAAVNNAPISEKYVEYYNELSINTDAVNHVLDSIKSMEGDIQDFATRWWNDLISIATSDPVDTVEPLDTNIKLGEAKEYEQLLLRYVEGVDSYLVHIQEVQATSLNTFQKQITELSTLYQNVVNTGVKVHELQSNTEIVTIDRSTVEGKALLLMIKVCNAMHVGKAIRTHYSAEPEACKLILELANKVGKGEDISHHANKGRTILS